MTYSVANTYRSHHIEFVIKYYEGIGYNQFKIKRISEDMYKVRPIVKVANPLLLSQELRSDSLSHVLGQKSITESLNNGEGDA